MKNNQEKLDRGEVAIYITGKLGEIVKRTLGHGENIMPAAAMWSVAKDLLKEPENKETDSLGIIDLSASGYTVIAVDKEGELKNDLLAINPHCGAGSGINLSRAMQKLNIKRKDVDKILKKYLGEGGKGERQKVSVRADRCGVFSSSATVSDKNQGIPLEHALAVTLKSEVLKACKKLSFSVDKTYLTGRIFMWQFARDCAEDYLKSIGVKEVKHDKDQSLLIRGSKSLVEKVGKDNFRKENPVRLRKEEIFSEYLPFSELKEQYVREELYERHPDTGVPELSPEIANTPVNIALDVGSTMAKMVISDAKTGQILFLNSYFNHGDTIETIKHIFKELQQKKIRNLNIQNIGVTGSGRYQVQKVLREVYPHLKERVEVLVENYAHARGSIKEARERIEELKAQGMEVNEDYCLLVDVGGEDTKVSIVSLKDGDLFDNAMNLKCSAGTGSLMDTLRTLFAIDNIEEACKRAYEAMIAYGINATCAVFLMENARKMQAQGYGKDEILSSCYWAIVENMARTLWPQVEFPKNAVTLLHGQTMLSDPLPLAVVHRLQEYTGSKMYGLAPSFPGHRACIGLIKSMEAKNQPYIDEASRLSDLIDCEFEKRIFTCHGAACGDKGSSCNRTALTFYSGGTKETIKLGGCTAVNDIAFKKKEAMKTPDTYKEIWKLIKSRMPESDVEDRLVIPRSFAISEQAFFLAKIFEKLGMPVHVDSVSTTDVLKGQPKFDIDTCAPNIGATGQFMRLASEKHGMILVPQVEYLSTERMSLGKTCTSNQGGPLIAMHFAKMENPEAIFFPFDINLENPDPVFIANQLFDQLQPVFEQYQLNITKEDLISAIKHAESENEGLKNEITENVADYLEKAIEDGANVAIACGREYILNPGVFDSYVGKLANDKGMVTIPSYVLDVALSEEFGYMYWRNPHHILTIINAVKDKKLHTFIKNERLKELIRKIEEQDGTNSLLGIILVSTFRCGPDSVTIPTIQELTKSIPFLIIQSDAAINELAHLENRVNTWLKQLTEGLQKESGETNGKDFTVETLDEYTFDTLNSETDVIYFPTIGDNRVIPAVVRAAGFTCIDNFAPETYDVERLIKLGRKYSGDAVCSPLAAVFADTLLAIEDFVRRKKENDPKVKGKTRVLIGDNKGAGPCRQGQYFEIHRLLLHRKLQESSKKAHGSTLDDMIIKFLVALEKDDFNPGIEEWVMAQIFQGVVIGGALESMFLKGGSNCKNHEEYSAFLKDYRKLTQEVYETIEKNAKPTFVQKALGQFAGKGLKTAKNFRELAQRVFGISEGKVPASLRKALKLAEKGLEQIDLEKFEGIDKYLEYGLYNNIGTRKLLEDFSKKWLHPQSKQKNNGNKIKIHADGEVYMRAAQIEEVFKELVDALGFGFFELSYTPIWAYFDYMCEKDIMIAKREIEIAKGMLENIYDSKERKRIASLIKEKEEFISKRQKAKGHLRNRFAKPVYKAAGVEMPHDMKEVLGAAKPILPRFKPLGELAPYVGEVMGKLKEGVDLVLNIAPDGCMVASMGDILTQAIMESTKESRKIRSRVQGLFSQDGEIDSDSLKLSLLKMLGPEGYYQARQ